MARLDYAGGAEASPKLKINENSIELTADLSKTQRVALCIDGIEVSTDPLPLEKVDGQILEMAPLKSKVYEPYASVKVNSQRLNQLCTSCMLTKAESVSLQVTAEQLNVTTVGKRVAFTLKEVSLNGVSQEPVIMSMQNWVSMAKVVELSCDSKEPHEVEIRIPKSDSTLPIVMTCLVGSKKTTATITCGIACVQKP